MKRKNFLKSLFALPVVVKAVSEIEIEEDFDPNVIKYENTPKLEMGFGTRFTGYASTGRFHSFRGCNYDWKSPNE